eukprot:scaffold29225_cov40-Attheya_sp.AAC.3
MNECGSIPIPIPIPTVLVVNACYRRDGRAGGGIATSTLLDLLRSLILMLAFRRDVDGTSSGATELRLASLD